MVRLRKMLGCDKDWFLSVELIYKMKIGEKHFTLLYAILRKIVTTPNHFGVESPDHYCYTG